MSLTPAAIIVVDASRATAPSHMLTMLCHQRRHAITYLNMKGSAAIVSAGVIDSQDDLLDDIGKISLQESRAVLCTHMLCLSLCGSVTVKEMLLWERILARVEEVYQRDRNQHLSVHFFYSLEHLKTPDELRDYAMKHEPQLESSLKAVATGSESTQPWSPLRNAAASQPGLTLCACCVWRRQQRSGQPAPAAAQACIGDVVQCDDSVSRQPALSQWRYSDNGDALRLL